MKKILSLAALFVLFLSSLMIPKVSAETLGDIYSDVAQDEVSLENLGIESNGILSEQPNRSYVYDWYIKDFYSEIVVNKDSSLDITENIVADCGNAYNKHGIFRVLPTVYYKEKGRPTKTPINLISITDFEGNPYNFSTIKDSYNNTITWKIGDADITVSGVNNYRIKYHVKNTIRFDNPDFDEFYWNLSGNFWDLEIDRFSASIIFPEEINQGNTQVYNYIGSYGYSMEDGFDYKWVSPNILRIEVNRTLSKEEGITTSVTFPKNIISPYIPTFWEKYGDMIVGIIVLSFPFIVFLICFSLWKKYGNDKPFSRSVAPEFDIPEKMDPIRMGIFMNNGNQKSKFLSAAIVNLAVKGYIKIEEIGKKGFFGASDTRLIKIKESDPSLSEAEKKLINGLFGGSSSVLISSLKNQFYRHLNSIKNAAMNDLVEKRYFEKKGFDLQATFWAIAGVFFIGLFFVPAFFESFMEIVYFIFISSILILVIFGFFMPKRSEEGQDLLLRIRGLKMYMTTAERYRQKFNEKENIFERFLPYAMLFGIVGLWTKKMKDIYGEDYFARHQPIWYIGSFNAGDLNFDSFTSSLNAISDSMASTMSSSPSSSGSGGGGFSGGGGGGGGGGGW
uniref:DUF2207 domain-containing protein n=1 Tax=candidate division CPR3 bacterium TaxID=2268181 RepID=A0A7C4M2N4_UNCC3